MQNDGPAWIYNFIKKLPFCPFGFKSCDRSGINEFSFLAGVALEQQQQAASSKQQSSKAVLCGCVAAAAAAAADGCSAKAHAHTHTHTMRRHRRLECVLRILINTQVHARAACVAPALHDALAAAVSVAGESRGSGKVGCAVDPGRGAWSVEAQGGRIRL